MKKLIIFDLDGTLIDTLDDLTNSVNFALSKRGYPLKTREDVRLAIGNGVNTLIKRCLPKEIEEEKYLDVLSIFVDHYAVNYKTETKPYLGVKNTLLKLKKDGYLLAVCTNKVQDLAEELLDLYFKNIFDFIQGDMSEVSKKPSADMVNRTVLKMGISKADTIYIGDTEVDEQTAHNSEVDYLLVSYGYRTSDELRLKTPKAKVVHNQDELYEHLKR